jgi:putative membrane protein
MPTPSRGSGLRASACTSLPQGPKRSGAPPHVVRDNGAPGTIVSLMGLLLSWLTVSLGLWVADKVLPDFKIEGGVGSYLLIGAVVGVLHFLLGWILYVLLGLATLGIGFLLGFVTRLVVSAIVLKVADALSSRFTIRGFLPAVLAAALMSLVSLGVDWIVR